MQLGQIIDIIKTNIFKKYFGSLGKQLQLYSIANCK